VSDQPSVTIAGGGLAGMTAALRLAERGCEVKLYEQKTMLGGNLASRTLLDGPMLDVYPHMFLGWYGNFWRMMSDVGVDRETQFAPLTSVRQLAEGRFPNFATLISGYKPEHLLDNLVSGWAAPEDMIVFGYAGVDLLAEHTSPTTNLHDLSLNGFLNTRSYMTKGALAAYETFITRVWAIPTYLVSAKDFRTYLGYCYGEPDATFWLTRGPAADVVVHPLEVALKHYGVKIRCGVEVTGVERKGDRVSRITLRRTKFNPRRYTWDPRGEAWHEPVDELVMAVPSTTLAKLVRAGARGQRIVEADRELAELVRLSTERVPIMHLCFKRRIDGIPPEPVGLLDSRLNLAFTDISQTWEAVPEFSKRTVCAVSCSETGALAGAHPSENAHEILTELAEYLDFDPGETWERSPEIDWRLTRFHENYDAKLSLNAVGTSQWRPRAASPALPNLSFAGDFCHGHIGLTTIESAVASGLAAARAIADRRGLEHEIEVLRPHRRPNPLYSALRYAFAPYVAGAKLFSMGAAQLPPAALDPRTARDSLVHYLLTPGLAPRHQRFDS
jgi:hypothetical protein